MKFTTLLFCICLTYIGFAQGNYIPDGADLSYPRSIIDAGQIETVRLKLQEEQQFQIYQSIYSYAQQELPSENISNEDRRKRAQIAREAAFVILMQKGIYNDTLQSLMSTEESGLLQKTLDILNNINTEVEVQEGWSFYYTWQFRSKELIHLLVAYDLLKGANVPDEKLEDAKTKLQTFSGNLYTRATGSYPNPIAGFPDIDFFFYNPNNHGIMVCGALGLAGIILADFENEDPTLQPANWINTAMWNLDNLLWKVDGLIPRVSEQNILAGYAEGPNYFYYGFQNAFPFIRAMWNYLPDQSLKYSFKNVERTIAHPWYDQNYYNLYKWMMLIRMPDGRSPSIHDSATSFSTNFTALSGYSEFNIPSESGHYHDFWTRVQYLCTDVAEGNYEEALFQALPDAGSLIFRNTYNDPSGIYMHLIGKNNIALYGAKAHHQADAMSFQLYYNGHTFAIDEGYTGSNYRSFVNKATDHNLILVDGKGPTPPLSEWVNNDNEVYIEHYFDMKSMDYGELTGSWQQADLIRKVLFIDDEYFIMWDDCVSSSPRKYQFQLHCSGLQTNDPAAAEGSVLIDPASNSTTISKSDHHVFVKTEATNGIEEYFLALDSTYNGLTTKYHNKTLAGSYPIDKLQFTSLIVPFADIAPSVQSFENIADGTALQVQRDDSQDFVFTQTQKAGRNIVFDHLTALWTNATNNFISVDQEQKLRMIHISDGDSLYWNELPIIQMDQRRNLSIEYDEDHKISAYINGPVVLKLYSDTSLVHSDGDIGNTYYDPLHKISTISILSAGYFSLEPGEAIISDVSSLLDNSANEKINISIYPNPTIDFCTVSISGINSSEIKWTLSDINGTPVIQNAQITGNKVVLQMDLSDLPPAAYILSIEDGADSRSVHLLKSN